MAGSRGRSRELAVTRTSPASPNQTFWERVENMIDVEKGSTRNGRAWCSRLIPGMAATGCSADVMINELEDRSGLPDNFWN